MFENIQKDLNGPVKANLNFKIFHRRMVEENIAPPIFPCSRELQNPIAFVALKQYFSAQSGISPEGTSGTRAMLLLAGHQKSGPW